MDVNDEQVRNCSVVPSEPVDEICALQPCSRLLTTAACGQVLDKFRHGGRVGRRSWLEAWTAYLGMKHPLSRPSQGRNGRTDGRLQHVCLMAYVGLFRQASSFDLQTSTVSNATGRRKLRGFSLSSRISNNMDIMAEQAFGFHHGGLLGRLPIPGIKHQPSIDNISRNFTNTLNKRRRD